MRSGPYEIFYSAFNTSFLAPEVATATSVVRAKDRVMVNISVRRDIDDDTNGKSEAISVHRIEGSSFNLIHRKQLAFEKVVEPGAIYYLAEFKLNNNNEMVVLDIEVTPAEGDTPIDVSFKRNFYLN